MRIIYIIFPLFFLTLVTLAQTPVTFWGNAGTDTGKIYYYLNQSKQKPTLISTDESGNYSLTIKSGKDSMITFYYEDAADFCAQTLSLNTIRKFNARLKTDRIQNDLVFIKGFGCMRNECAVPTEQKKYTGLWTGSGNMTLEIDCYYKMEYPKDSVVYSEEGKWEINDQDQLLLTAVYLQNKETKTYSGSTEELIINYRDNTLFSVYKGLNFTR